MLRTCALLLLGGLIGTAVARGPANRLPAQFVGEWCALRADVYISAAARAARTCHCYARGPFRPE